MHLTVTVLSFHLTPARRLHVPPEKYANVIRGALGLALGPEDYRRLFGAEMYVGRAPGGMKSAPRPFVLRVAEAVEGIGLRIHLLGESAAELGAVFGEAVERVAAAGLGPGRVATRVEAVGEAERMEIPLAPLAAAPERVRVEFLTPTELKVRGEVEPGAPFGALLARARDRVMFFACAGEQSGLAKELAVAGEGVRQTAAGLRRVEVERVSTRTGARHGIGGFVGHADYEGDLRVTLPWLLAAEWTGVGRQTVWGKGAIRCSALADAAGGGGR